MTDLYDLAGDWREEDDEEQDPADEDYREPEPENADPDWDEDGHQQYKDDLAQGLIHEDGTQRDPDEPDWGAEEYGQHRDEAHGGGECDCPRPDWPEPEPGVVYSDEPPF